MTVVLCVLAALLASFGAGYLPRNVGPLGDFLDRHGGWKACYILALCLPVLSFWAGCHMAAYHLGAAAFFFKRGWRCGTEAYGA